MGLVGLQPGLHPDSRRVPRPGGVGGDCRLLPPPSHGPLHDALTARPPAVPRVRSASAGPPSKVNGLCCIFRFFFFLFLFVVCIDVYVCVVVVSAVVVAFGEL